MKTKFCLLFAVLLPMMALAQYTTTQFKAIVDITSNATSGTNAWKYMAGTPSCAQNSLAVGRDGSVWCANTYVYKYNVKSHSWDAQTAMGTTVVGLAVMNANTVYALIPAAPCPGQYGLFLWSGSSWTEKGGCYIHASVAIDGGLDAINNISQWWTSSDGGNSWTLQSGTWRFVSEWGAGYGCGINMGNSVYLINPTHPLDLKAAIPSGTAVGCVLAYDDSGPSILVWNTAGAAFVIAATSHSSSWATITGPGSAITQIVGSQKGLLIGLDNSGKPYHWNIFAPYISSTTSGKYIYCPTGQFLCQNQNTPIHAGHLWTKFSSGHGINYSAGIQSTLVAPSAQMNLSSWDVNPQCDPLLGHPDDPECTSDTYGYEHCNVANADLPQNPTQNPNPPGGESIDVAGFVRTRQASGPYLTPGSTPFEGGWQSLVKRDYYEACNAGTVATCPENYTVPFTRVMTQPYTSPDGSLIESDIAQGEVMTQMLQAIAGEDLPEVIYQPYTTLGGVNVCSGAKYAQLYYGDWWAVPDCR